MPIEKFGRKIVITYSNTIHLYRFNSSPPLFIVTYFRLTDCIFLTEFPLCNYSVLSPHNGPTLVFSIPDNH
jgi:hypothetical protein